MFDEEEEEESQQLYKVKPPSSLSPGQFFSFAPRTLGKQINPQENVHELLSDDDSDSNKENDSFDDIPPPVLRDSIETQTPQNEYIFQNNDYDQKKEENFVFNDEQPEDYESQLIDIKMTLSDLNDKINSLKNECSTQNQTKLNADISYLRQMMKSIRANVDTQNMHINDMKYELETLVVPPQYDESLSRLRNMKNVQEQCVYTQIESMCKMLDKCEDEKFKEDASLLLARKTSELQKVMDEKTTLINQLSVLQDQFLKQDQFINEQKYKQDKRLMKKRLIKQYYKDMQNIQISALEVERKESNNLQHFNHFVLPHNSVTQSNHEIHQSYSSSILPPISSNKQQTNQFKQYTPVRPVMRPLRSFGMSLASSHADGNRTARTHSFFRMRQPKKLEPISNDFFNESNSDSDSN